MSWDRASLPWLPAAPADFKTRCQAIAAATDPGLEARALASTRLNANQLTSLGRVLKKLAADSRPLAPLMPVSLALIGDGSHELIVEALIGTAPRYGLHFNIIEIPFNSGEWMSIDPGSALHRAPPDIVALNFTYRPFLQSAAAYDDEASARDAVDHGLGRLRAIVDGLSRSAKTTLIVQTIPPPPTDVFGSFDRLLPGTARSMVEALNRGTLALARSPRVLLDAATLAEKVGLDAWHDQTQWDSYKLPFAQRFVALYADHVARTVAAVRGLSRKCLVLDLDNTLWGGVIGDDGLDGIRLGQGLADGEAFLEVQRAARQLRRRGIVLAVSSKNTDAVARQPFRDHPDMILTESDISVFQANWDDKPRNLEAIAQTLNIGLDSLVLLDDNPAERELVRQKLPLVGVPELPEDPALFTHALLDSGLFEAVSYSAEDARRAEMYTARAVVAARREGAADLASFLDSLEMVITFAPFDPVGRSRIAQLINKSNQFNLTTRRYTEAEVQAMESDPQLLTLQVRLKDKFTDHGMIGVVIGRALTSTDWEIDTWLMSCRVLGRRVEEAVLREVVALAGSRGARQLIGRFIPSGRNGMVADHYRKLGFTALEQSETQSAWALQVAEFSPPELPFQFRRPVSK